MAPKKKPVRQESFLNSVARKLGHAAGTVTKATHDFADNVSTLPETIATRAHEFANSGTTEETQAKTKQTAKKRVHGVVPARRAKSKARPKPAMKRKTKRSTKSRASNR